MKIKNKTLTQRQAGSKSCTPLSASLCLLSLLSAPLTLSASPRGEGVGRAYFQELRANAAQAMRRLDDRINDAFDREFEDEDDAELNAEQAAQAHAAQPSAQLTSQAEQARREAEQARREAEQARREAEQARREAEQARREAAKAAERVARERFTQEAEARRAEELRLEEQARKAEARAERVRAAQARKAAERAQHVPLERAVVKGPEGGQSFEAQVLELVNQERARGGRCGDTTFEPAPPVKHNATLALAAQAHSEAMERQRFFDHTDPQGDGPRERIDAQGYQGRAWGENIAAGQRSPESVMKAWMSSPGHCKNILNPLFNELGVGLVLNAQGPYRTYWTQNFGRR